MKKYNRIWLSALALLLVFSLTCGCVVYALDDSSDNVYIGLPDDEAECLQLYNELYTPHFDRNESDTGVRAQLGELLYWVHRSLYTVNGSELQQAETADKLELLKTYKEAKLIYADQSRSDTQCEEIYDRLSYAYYGCIPPSDDDTGDDTYRQDAWEELNSLTFTADSILSSVGDYYTSNYISHLNAANVYSKHLLDDPYSTYDQLSTMADDLSYMISEKSNPANRDHPLLNTAVFTDSLGWGEPIYIYAWNGYDGFEMSAWPGDRTLYTYTNSYGQKQYYTYIPREYSYIIFSNGAQTVDIPFTGSMGFYATGETDSNGCYKVNSFELNAPVYHEYPDIVQPTSPTVTAAETEVPTQPATQDWENNYWDTAFPNSSEYVGVVRDEKNTELLNELYDLINYAEHLFDPGNEFPSAKYKEDVMKVRNVAADYYKVFVRDLHYYNFTLPEYYQAAIDALQLVIDGGDINKAAMYFNHYLLGEEPEGEYKLGDANGDGQTDAVDATVVQRADLGIATNIPAAILAQGDVDGSGTVDIIDATYIQRYSIRMSTPFDIGNSRFRKYYYYIQ